MQGLYQCLASLRFRVNTVQRFEKSVCPHVQVAVKQLDVVLADGAMDCTFGGLTATAHAAADPVQFTALLRVFVLCTGRDVRSMAAAATIVT